jgi:hypothetical protein
MMEMELCKNFKMGEKRRWIRYRFRRQPDNGNMGFIIKKPLKVILKR